MRKEHCACSVAWSGLASTSSLLDDCLPAYPAQNAPPSLPAPGSSASCMATSLLTSYPHPLPLLHTSTTRGWEICIYESVIPQRLCGRGFFQRRTGDVLASAILAAQGARRGLGRWKDGAWRERSWRQRSGRVELGGAGARAVWLPQVRQH